MKILSKLSFYLLHLLCVALLILPAACANIGNPSGGPRDEDPPIFLRSDPPQGAVNVSKTHQTLTFNELVNVKNAFSTVVVSPVSKAFPKIASSGRNVTISFDSLQNDVTYTIDFANSIEDNNEANPLQGFAYTFSTGPSIDTLRISGMVLAARNLEPQQGMLVGVTQNLADSAFTTLPFLRVAKTDDRGRFSIRGLKEGKYRVYALNDMDNDYKYANPEEDMAFYDVIISPSAESAVASDTIYNHITGEVDSIISRMRTRFLPNNILLRSFNSDKRKRYLEKYERLDSTRLFLKFNTGADTLPELEIIGYPDGLKSAVTEYNQTNDSVVVWLPEPLTHVDSLLVRTNYLATDSTGSLNARIDSLKFFRLRRPEPKSNKKDKKNQISVEDSIRAATLNISASLSGGHDIYEPIKLSFETPLARLDSNAVRIDVKVDTVWRPLSKQPSIQRADSMNARNYIIPYAWDFGRTYRLTIDSLAATGIYGKSNRELKQEFTIKKKDDYCSLRFNISGLDPEIPAFVELLSQSDAPVRVQKVVNNTVFFQYLNPGKYYARVIEDFNGNEKYDTGDYDNLLQPELAYYYPKVINIKKNWDRDETWDVFATPIDLMKPEQIKKNKPASDPRSRNNNNNNNQQEEEEDDYFDPTVNPFDPNSRPRRPSY